MIVPVDVGRDCIRMKTAEFTWRILLAAVLMNTVWAATATEADERSNTAVVQPTRAATTAIATPSKPIPIATRLAQPVPNSFRPQRKRLRLASRFNRPAPECYSWPFCREFFPFFLGIAYWNASDL
jgi:hypothetical protein